MSKKLEVHEFDLTPYKRKLWVVKNGDAKTLNESFNDKENKPLENYFLDIKYFAGYVSEKVLIKKDTGYFGIVVNITSGIKNKEIAHEAIHVVGTLFGNVGVDFDFNNQEPFTYIAEYVYDCIEKVAKNRITI